MERSTNSSSEGEMTKVAHPTAVDPPAVQRSEGILGHWFTMWVASPQYRHKLRSWHLLRSSLRRQPSVSRLAEISEGFFWFTVAGPDLLVPTAAAGHGAWEAFCEAFCEVLAGIVEEE